MPKSLVATGHVTMRAVTGPREREDLWISGGWKDQ